jgi:DNA-binding beta-propeller fold protein YncE
MSINRKNLLKLCFIGLILATALFNLPSASNPTTTVTANNALDNYVNFDAPHGHPLALTPDGTRLLAVNSANGTLSVLNLAGGLPQLAQEIPVGLEPVTVVARTNDEAWVVNWLSDNISIVNLTTGNVVNTVAVGDEPTDLVFAGAPEKAYVAVSGLRQVKVLDVNNIAAAPQVLTIEGKQPRALAKDDTGKRVFVSVFESGNQTTVVQTSDVRKAGGLPAPNPPMSTSLPGAPLTSIIVKRQGKNWVDETGDKRWTKFVPHTLADNDVVMIDASTSTPQIRSQVQGIGTHIGNAVFDPATNRLMVINTDSQNVIRFEPKVRGRFIRTQVAAVTFKGRKGQATNLDLNPHIDYNNADGTARERELSLALPADIARARDGRFFVSGLGSNRIGVLDAAGNIQQRVNVGQGPTGLAVDTTRQQLYVLNRFDATISIIETNNLTELTRVALGNNAEPLSVREGRQFLYGAQFSAHGDVSCASCHRDGHLDGLAWDLGDPQGKVDIVRSNPVLGNRPFTLNLHPMKGPMVTQSLRGIIGTEPLHWRGDRAKLIDFRNAFPLLLGSPQTPDDAQMAAFERFIRTLAYPPNPMQNLDRSYTASAARGERIFRSDRTDRGTLTCNACHTAPPGTGTNGLLIPGIALLMDNGEPETQPFKIPQLRGIYQKVGFEKRPGKQLSGFGFVHDGVTDTLFNFLKTPNFTFRNDDERRDVENFVLSFDTGTAPSVGAQVTVNNGNKTDPATLDRLAVLINQADRQHADLVVRGRRDGQLRRFLYVGNGMFQSDRSGEALLPAAALVSAVTLNGEITFTGVPVGMGRRFSIDTNLDGRLNGDN